MFFISVCLTPLQSEAKGGGHSRRSGKHSSGSRKHSSGVKTYKTSNSTKRAVYKVPKTGRADNYYDKKGILRDSKTGKIHRSQTAIYKFQKQHPCPSTGKISGACPGYQIDHYQALENGGADAPSNMQWLSIRDHQLKTANDNKNTH
jgi:hypothetical protein